MKNEKDHLQLREEQVFTQWDKAPDIHCASSKHECASGSSPQDDSKPDREEQAESDDMGMIIDFSSWEDTPWDSEVDGARSDTSTPAYKCGNHQEAPLSTNMVVQIIRKEGMQFHNYSGRCATQVLVQK